MKNAFIAENFAKIAFPLTEYKFIYTDTYFAVSKIWKQAEKL